MIIGIGETVLDIIFKNDQPQMAVPGGSTFNAIISLGRAGLPCAILTEAGSDHVGDLTCRYLCDNGVSDRFVYRREGVKSHISLAFLNERNDACYQFYKDHASVSLGGELPSFSKGDIVLFGSFFAVNPAIREVVGRLLRDAHDAGAALYYDVNFRAPHRADLPRVMGNIEENMRLSTIVRGSTEDFSLLYDMPSLLGPSAEQAVDRLYEERIRPLCPIFICTSGADSIYLRTPSLRENCPVAQIPTLSTVGAGDNFNAGFIYALARMAENMSCSPKQLLQSLALIGERVPEGQDRGLESFISSGQLFAQDVCRQFGNSISPELAAELKK